MVSPAARPALVLGKALSAAVRGFSQAVIIYVLSLALGIGVSLLPSHVVGAILFVALGAILFSTLSLIMACLVKTRERFMGIGQLVVMPLFFASSALYPLAIMPGWLRIVAHANPLSYEVHGMRDLLLGISAGGLLWLDFAVMISFLIVTAVIAAKTYPRAIL
jgi:ABC-2 type transport system permease protein